MLVDLSGLRESMHSRLTENLTFSLHIPFMTYTIGYSTTGVCFHLLLVLYMYIF